MALLLAFLQRGMCLAAPPKLDGFFPAGGQRGTQVELTGIGEFPDWPVEVWCDRAGVTLTPAEKQGTFQLSVASDAACGVYRVRVHTAQGASSLQPLVIGDLPERVEQEPNDAPGQAEPFAGSLVWHGKLAKAGDVDGFRIPLAKGQRLVASLQANELLGSPMDGVLQIALPAGFVLAQNDDERRLDPQLEFVAPRDGEYVVRVFAFPKDPNSSIAFAGAETYRYRLTIGLDAFTDYAMPLSATNGGITPVRLIGVGLADDAPLAVDLTAADAPLAELFRAATGGSAPILRTDSPTLVVPDECDVERPLESPVPAVVSGILESRSDEDVVRLTLAKGDKIAARVEARSLGFPTDSLLRMIDADGKQLAENDDQGKEPDSLLSFTAPTDGMFRLAISDVNGHGGPRFAYRLTIERDLPRLVLTTTADHFEVKQGEKLEMTVAIERRGGHAAPVTLTIEGLPDGVTSESVTVDGKAKEAKLTIQAGAAPCSGMIQLLGTSEGSPTPTPVTSADTAQLWLTVTP